MLACDSPTEVFEPYLKRTAANGTRLDEVGGWEHDGLSCYRLPLGCDFEAWMVPEGPIGQQALFGGFVGIHKDWRTVVRSLTFAP